jgi:hypothetical protein
MEVIFIFAIDACWYSALDYSNALSRNLLFSNVVIASAGTVAMQFFPDERPALIGPCAKLWLMIEHTVSATIPFAVLLLAIGTTVMMVKASLYLGIMLGGAWVLTLLLVGVAWCLVIMKKPRIDSEHVGVV